MWSSTIFALLGTQCITASCSVETCDSDGSSLLQARSLVRKAHSTDAEAVFKAHSTDAEAILNTVSKVAKALSEGSEITMSEDDVNDALGDTETALNALIPTFAQAHSTAQAALNTALASVEACHTEHGGEVLTRLETELASESSIKENCNDLIAAAAAAEEDACKVKEGEEESCLCHEARKETIDQRAICEAVTDTYMLAFCDHKIVCDMLEECHEEEAAAFNTLANSSRLAMVSRQQQYSVVKQSECITDLIIAAMIARRPINHADMIACSNVTTDHLILTFPELPDEPTPCPEPAEGDPSCNYQVIFDSANDDFTTAPGRLSGTGRMNWYHTANSAREIGRDDDYCGFEFKFSSSSTSLQMMIGIADSTVTYYSHLDWCIYVTSSTLYVYRSGSNYFSMAYIKNPRDVHKIFVNQDHHTEFSLNGVVYYSSSTPPSYPWHVALDAYEAPGITHAEYVKCGERHLPKIKHGDKVEFDQHHDRYTTAPGALTGTGSFSWSKTANSAREFNYGDGVCGITFKCNSSNAILMIGITDTFVTYYSGIDFSVYLTGSSTAGHVYEAGSNRYQLNGRRNNGRIDTDEYAIRINENGQVEYALNNLVYYTSSRTLQYPWHVAVDSSSNPSLTDIEYIECGEGDVAGERGDEVEFDVSDSRLTVSPGAIVGSTSYSWNAPANSAHEFGAGDGVCGVEFKCNTSSSHFIMGLSSTYVSQFSNVQFGIVCRGTYGAYTDIYESNSLVRRIGGRSNNGDPTRDVHSVRINGHNQVEYALNGRVWHTSTRTPTYPWHVAFDAYSTPVASDVKYISCDSSSSSCTNTVAGNLHTYYSGVDSYNYMFVDTNRQMIEPVNVTSITFRCYRQSSSYNIKFQVYRQAPAMSSRYYDLIAETPWISSSGGHWGSSYKTVQFDSPLFFERGDYFGWSHNSYGIMNYYRRNSNVFYKYGQQSVGSRIYFNSNQARDYSYQINMETC